MADNVPPPRRSFPSRVTLPGKLALRSCLGSRRTSLVCAAILACVTMLAAPDLNPAQAQRPARAAGGRSIPNAAPLQIADDAPGARRDFPPQPEPPPEGAPPVQPPQPGWAGAFQPEQMVSPTGLSSTLNLLILMTVLSLAPSILMMTTCFIRFIVVMGLLRQALGTQQLPPNQVIIGLCMFLTFMVMAPVWQQSYDQGIKPYTNPLPGQAPPSLEETYNNTLRPIRRYMSEQIERTDNSETVWLFIDYQKPAPDSAAARNYHKPETYDEVPLTALLPAFMLSELKTSFIIGFQLYLPFVVIDMVVAAILMSMGMMMLPPTLISFPFKLLLFVLIDGLYLTVGMMLESVRPFS